MLVNILIFKTNLFLLQRNKFVWGIFFMNTEAVEVWYLGNNAKDYLTNSNLFEGPIL